MRYLGIVLALLALIILFVYAPYFNPSANQEAEISLERLSAENASRLQEIARFGNGGLTGAIAWSTETETLAAGTATGLWLYTLPHLDTARFLDLDTRVNDLVFLNEGQYLAYTTAAGAEIIELETGNEIMRFPEAHVIAAHPNGNYLLVDKNIYIEGEAYTLTIPTLEMWDIQTKEMIQSFSPSEEEANILGLHIRDIAVSNDGVYLATSYSSYTEDTCGHRNSFVLIWDSTKPEDEAYMLAGSEYVEFSPDSRFLVSQEFDSWMPEIAALNVLELSSKEVQLLYTIPEDNDSWNFISWFGFDPITGELMSLSEGLLRYWTLPELQKSQEIDLGNAIGTFIPTEDGHIIGTDGEGIHVWDRHFENEQFIPVDSPFTFVDFFDSGDGFSRLDENNRLHLWRINEDLELQEFFVSASLPESNYKPVLSANANYLAYEDHGQIRVIATHDNQIVAEIGNANFPMTFSPDSEKLLLSRIVQLGEFHSESYFQIWDIPSNTFIREFGPYERTAQITGASSAQFSADGTQLGIKYRLRQRDGQYTVFSILTGDEIYSYEIEDAYGTWTPDLNGLIINGGDFSRSTSWFVNPSIPTIETEPFRYYPYAGHVSHINDATNLFFFITSSHTGCGGDYRQLYVHHLPDMETLWTIGLPMGGWDSIDALFNPHGDLVFTNDSLVDAYTGEVLFQLPHGNYPSVAFSADGKFLLTNQSGVIRLWGVPDTED